MAQGGFSRRMLGASFALRNCWRFWKHGATADRLPRMCARGLHRARRRRGGPATSRCRHRHRQRRRIRQVDQLVALHPRTADGISNSANGSPATVAFRPPPTGKDRRDFAEFYADYDPSQNMVSMTGWAVNWPDPLQRRGCAPKRHRSSQSGRQRRQRRRRIHACGCAGERRAGSQG